MCVRSGRTRQEKQKGRGRRSKHILAIRSGVAVDGVFVIAISANEQVQRYALLGEGGPQNENEGRRVHARGVSSLLHLLTWIDLYDPFAILFEGESVHKVEDVAGIIGPCVAGALYTWRGEEKEGQEDGKGKEEERRTRSRLQGREGPPHPWPSQRHLFVLPQGPCLTSAKVRSIPNIFEMITNSANTPGYPVISENCNDFKYLKYVSYPFIYRS